MKQKFGTILDRDVLCRAKLRAAEEGRPLNDLIQDALEKYLAAWIPEPARRQAAFQLFCEHPIKLSSEQFIALLKHDSWDAVDQ